jgi:hypothetical protein
MVKILNGMCASGIVTALTTPIPRPVAGCKILGDGIGASEGFVVLSDTDAWYLPRISGDTKQAITQLKGALGALKDCLGSPADPPLPLPPEPDAQGNLYQALVAGGVTATAAGIWAANATALALNLNLTITALELLANTLR